VVICLERGANDLHMVQLMPEWFTFLVPDYPGCPGKKDVVVAVVEQDSFT